MVQPCAFCSKSMAQYKASFCPAHYPYNYPLPYTAQHPDIPSPHPYSGNTQAALLHAAVQARFERDYMSREEVERSALGRGGSVARGPMW